mmetsp:Transcript_34691/g.86551  ORF Transcript_34691/g.86551 Transcript_34691/m.86551 type:complete len:208 (+) Transcript_34691:185-808(+)
MRSFRIKWPPMMVMHSLKAPATESVSADVSCTIISSISTRQNTSVPAPSSMASVCRFIEAPVSPDSSWNARRKWGPSMGSAIINEKSVVHGESRYTSATGSICSRTPRTDSPHSAASSLLPPKSDTHTPPHGPSQHLSPGDLPTSKASSGGVSFIDSGSDEPGSIHSPRLGLRVSCIIEPRRPCRQVAARIKTMPLARPGLVLGWRA